MAGDIQFGISGFTKKGEQQSGQASENLPDLSGSKKF
jgi:hypothetical protein